MLYTITWWTWYMFQKCVHVTCENHIFTYNPCDFYIFCKFQIQFFWTFSSNFWTFSELGLCIVTQTGFTFCLPPPRALRGNWKLGFLKRASYPYCVHHALLSVKCVHDAPKHLLKPRTAKKWKKWRPQFPLRGKYVIIWAKQIPRTVYVWGKPAEYKLILTNRLAHTCHLLV